MDTKIKLQIDMNKEVMGIYIGKAKIAQLDFLIDTTQINVADITIIDEKRLQGYGYLLLNALKGIAQFYKKPIYLISYSDKVPFYKKNDFISLGEFSRSWSFNGDILTLLINGKDVNIKNINPERVVEEQISNVDMLWIPSALKEVDVYL